MRDKIAGYLELVGRALPAEQILREVLNIRSPNAFAAEKVLRGILGKDPRFKHRQGLWHLKARAAPRAIETAALDLETSVSHPGSFRGAVQNASGCTAWEFLRAGDVCVTDLKPLKEARQQAEDCMLLVWSGKQLRLWNRLLRSVGVPQWQGETIALIELAAQVNPQASECRALEDLAPILGLAQPEAEPFSARARFLLEAGRILLDQVPAEHRASPADLTRWLKARRARIDFSRFAFGRDFIAGIPESPGVYVMRDRAGEVIYVGKSANLRRRVSSYFRVRALRDPKTVRIHDRLYSLEVLMCATEVDALMLEMHMIRDFRPAINLQEQIHEQSGRYGFARNVLLLVPAADKVEVYFLKDSVFVARRSVAYGYGPSKKLRARIESIYFASKPRKTIQGEEWETVIVARWLSANRRRMNFIDVEEAGTLEAVVGRLESYLKDPDRLAHKVYYR